MRNFILAFILLSFVSGVVSASDDFLAQFDTTYLTSGSTSSNSLKLPTVSSGTYDFIVYWGDGSNSSVKSYNSANITHVYSVPGKYNVTISGTFDGVYYANTNDRNKLHNIIHWGDLTLGNTGKYFYGCEHMRITADDTPDLSSTYTFLEIFRGTYDLNDGLADWDVSGVTNMRSAFYASNFNGNISNWNTSSVTDMQYMFGVSPFNSYIGDWDTSSVIYMQHMFKNTPFNQDIGGWDMSYVTDMNNMFRSSLFNQDIDAWNTSHVTTMNSMFYDSDFNQNISSWDVHNVIDMSSMFYDSDFNGIIGDWDVSKVTTMNSMFRGSSFDRNISSWNTSKVTNMYSMFYDTPFNQDIGDWDVSLVTDMRYLFRFAPFNQDIGGWNTSNVINMSGMFSSSLFNQDIGAWNTSKVAGMTSMFYDSPFDQDIGGFDIGSVTNMEYMFNLGSLSRVNYDHLLSGWSSQTPKVGVSFDVGTAKYCDNTSRNILINSYNWSITDGGYDSSCSVTTTTTLPITTTTSIPITTTTSIITTTLPTTTTTLATTTTLPTTTTTTLALPLYIEFVLPSAGSNVYIEQNITTEIKTISTCGSATCSNANVYLFGSGFSVLSSNPSSCGSMVSGQQCNSTFTVNITGNVNSTYYSYARFYTPGDFYNSDGFNLTVVEFDPGALSAVETEILGIGRNHYVLSGDVFSLNISTKCRYGYCGDVNVTLRGVGNGSGVYLYTNSSNPQTCVGLSSGASCVLGFEVYASGSNGSIPVIYSEAIDEFGDNDTSEDHYIYILYDIPPVDGYGVFNDTFYCNITGYDDDGDDIFVYDDFVTWYSNGTEIYSGDQTLICHDDVMCYRGNDISCIACLIDEHGYDEACAQSGSMHINNTLPVAYPYITPVSPSSGQDLVCNENATDYEGDSLNYTYKWFMNDTETFYTSKVLGFTATEGNQNWSCQVTVYDGIDSIKANSTYAFVTGACPSIPVLSLPFNHTSVSTYPINFDWLDSSVYGGGNITYHIQVSNSSNFSVNIIDVNPITRGYQAYETLEEDEYLWRVRAFSSGCYSDWSDIFVFDRTNGTCYDGIKNQNEDNIDCGGQCDPCTCANISMAQVTIIGEHSASGLLTPVKINITDNVEFERHCYDGCFGPEFGETDTDCGGWGIWACPQCGIDQRCFSNYDCQDGLYCKKEVEGYNNSGVCASNAIVDACSNGIFNPTVGESDVDCGGPCNRCEIGKVCVGTIDCKAGLVCDQYDICATPSEETQLKKGRQYGGVGLRGLGMSEAFCDGPGVPATRVTPEKPFGIGGMIGCSQIPFPTDPLGIFSEAPFTGWDEGMHLSNSFSVPISAKDFSKLWLENGYDQSYMSNIRVVYHLDVLVPDFLGSDEGVWMPYWMASTGEEYKCHSDQDCTNLGVWGVADQSVGDSYLNLGKCDYNDWTVTSTIGGALIGDINCKLVCGAKYYEDTYFSTDFVDKCPDECKHCIPFPGSEPFEGYSTGGFLDFTGIRKPPSYSQCMFIPLCNNFKYRIAAKIYEIGPDGRQKELPRIARYPFTTCVDEFTITKADKESVELTCTDALDLPGPTNYQYDYLEGCTLPPLWDVGKCDGEAFTSVYDFLPLQSTKDDYRRYYAETGCEYVDKVKAFWFIRSSCALSPDDDMLFSSLLQAPLKEFGLCDDPKDVVLDFTDVYEKALSNPKFMDGKFYRAYDDASSSKKVMLLVSRIADDNKECLVYDNLNSNAFRIWTDSLTYFDLYRGGDSISQGRYGPRIRLPLCEGYTYSVRLYFIDNALSLHSDQSYNSYWDYILSLEEGISPKEFLSYALVDFTDDILPISIKNKLAEIDPDMEFKCMQTYSRDGSCVHSKYMDVMAEAGGVVELSHDQFTLDTKNTEYLNPVTNKPYCYTDYYVKIPFNYGEVNDFGLKWYNISTKNSATLLEYDKWITTFYVLFDPLNWSLPYGYSINAILNVFSTKGIFGGLYLILLILVFYVSKILVWIMLYGLISYMWIAMAQRGSSIYMVMLAIFLILLILAKFGTYGEFIDMLRIT